MNNYSNSPDVCATSPEENSDVDDFVALDEFDLELGNIDAQGNVVVTEEMKAAELADVLAALEKPDFGLSGEDEVQGRDE